MILNIKKSIPKNRNIKIYGQVSSTQELIKFYNDTDIFILPSMWKLILKLY